MSIKQSIVRPVMILAVAIFCGGLVVSGTVIVASTRTNAGAREALTITRETQRLSTQMQHAQEYLNQVLDMTHFVEASVLEKDLHNHTSSIHNSLNVIAARNLPPHLSAHIDLLRHEFNSWEALLMQRLGLSGRPDIPTRLVLDQQANTVILTTRSLAATSAEFVSQVIENVRHRILSIFGVAMVSTLAILGLAVLFAYRRASEMSQSVLGISTRLLSLARRDTAEVDNTKNELEAVHQALNQLDEALQEKRRMECTLRAEKTRAEAATETKSRFLATMSHEIRTPINGVLGMAELLHESPLSSEQRSYSETILASSEALLRIVNDILDFSKLEAGKTVLLQQPFNLRDVVFDVATLVAPNAAAKGIEICIDVPDDTPRQFIGDNGRIRQVLMNLIGNAVKFTTEGFVGITVSYDADQELPLTVTICDTGVGIPAEQLDHIFKAFEQVESTTARRFEGTGLGLAISTHLVEAMQGQITATSTLGDGSCFTLHLGLPLTEDAFVPSPRLVKYGDDLAGKSILLIAHQPFARDLRSRLLASWGVTVHWYDGCDSALKALPDLPPDIDLVLVESGMDAEAAEHFSMMLWQSAGRASVPIIFATDAQHVTALQSLKARGSVTALMKPPRNGALMQAMIGALYPDRISQARSARTPKDEANLSAYNILIAEDNRTNQLVLRKMLASTGVQMTFCNDGQAAVDAYRSGVFDMVLMDMSMPIMDGLQATRMIRKIESDRNHPPCPIVALTANVMDTDEDACREAGMMDFLTKPVRKQVVIKAIATWARRDEQREVSGF
ncbi:response regulator [Epibacterium ulvae]|uniref:response regulator n=1 Tax=Epibacterium ulvae TaxID=1156985 RepID=UPI001BFBFEF0|nr:response regulator [Epibacterium ulvae]MBT8155645.1 response regulator [Epibacterium ulvae]